MLLKDKVAIITGATSGIGRATAILFGKQGAKVVVNGRNEDRMEELKKTLTDQGTEHLAIRMDVSNEEANIRMIEDTLKQFGRIDILVTNAAISMRALFNETGLDIFRRVMDINFYGAVYPVKYALPYLLESKGTIVGVSSINGHRGTPARSAYCASKFALEGFYESLRTEVMKKGVHVFVVSPGDTDTNIRIAAIDKYGHPQGESPLDETKSMRPESVARIILNGMLRKKRHMVLTRKGRMVVFLNKWLPGWMDKVVYQHLSREKGSPF